MKYYLRDSEFEQAVQQVESLMTELGLSLHVVSGGINIEWTPEPDMLIEAAIKDAESHSDVSTFPRFTDSEVLAVIE